MELLKHFKEEHKDFVLLYLKDDEWEEFLYKLPIEYRKSYITDSDLERRVKNFSTSPQIELSEILPTEGNIKSGDFGEILTYFLLTERHKNQNVNGPRKWRWKQEKNVPAPYTDVILFSIKSGKPSINDLLISAESKMKSTINKDYHPIQNAIDGAEKDYVSRIANSLSWLRKKHKDESLKEGAPVERLKSYVDSIERFIKSETLGEYTKQLKAVAFVDKSFLTNEIMKEVSLPSVTGILLEVIVVSIKDLKTAYEKVFEEMPKL
jgi:hypothetical protein